MNAPCEHHKTCGDCFGPNHVMDLENEVEYLANGYANATEMNLATLEELALLKGTSRSRIDRQKSICKKMLQHCRAVTAKINWGAQWNCKNPRTQRLHMEADLDAALDAEIARLRKP